MKLHRNESGMGLTDVLVGAGVFGIIVLGMQTFMMNSAKETRNLRLVTTRDSLVRQLSAALMNEKSYSYSLSLNDSRNANLSICINGDSSAPTPAKCAALSGTTPVDTGFALFSPGSTQPLSGPKGSPAYFTADGSSCKAPDPNACPLQVETWFQADCGGTVDCLKASDLNFFYSVTSVDGTKPPLKPATNVTLPIAFSSIVGSQSPSQVAEAASSGTQPNLSCYSTGCCMAVGTQVFCKAIPGTGAISFASDFGTWNAVAAYVQGLSTSCTSITGMPPLVQIPYTFPGGPTYKNATSYSPIIQIRDTSAPCALGTYSFYKYNEVVDPSAILPAGCVAPTAKTGTASAKEYTILLFSQCK